MQRKQLYTIIAAVIFLIHLYSVGTAIYYSFKYFSFFWLRNLLPYIPSLLALAGAAIFYFSGFTKSRLLRLYMCIEVVGFPFVVWFYSRYFTGTDEYNFSKPVISISMIIAMFLFLLLTACCCAGLWLLSKDQKIKLTYVEYGTERVAQFEPAKAGLRFANRIVDVLVIVFLLFQLISQYRLLHSGIFSFENRYAGLYVLEAVTLIIYYFLLEGIFNTTAGKCATGTVIVNENGERPGFAQLLGRTLCRFIPFDALSFLGAGARGWHDSLTGTYVVSAARSDEEAMEEITLDAEKAVQIK